MLPQWPSSHLTRLLETGKGSAASPSIWYVHRWPRSLIISSHMARLMAARMHRLPMIHPGRTEGTKCCVGHVTRVKGGCADQTKCYGVRAACRLAKMRRVPGSWGRCVLVSWGDGAPGRT